MAEFICLNYFVTELSEILEVDGLRLPIPYEFANRLCDALGVDPCAGCLPGEDPPVFVDTHTRLMINHNGRFEIVKVTGCEQGVPVIERGEESTEPLRFPKGACVQFVWTCQNIADIVAQTSDAISHGLNYDSGTGDLDLLIDGEVESTVNIPSGGGGEVPVTGMSYDKPTNQLTLDLAGGTTISSIVSPYVVSSSYDVGSEQLTIILSDGTTFTTTIPQTTLPTDVHLNSATYNTGTRIMSLGLTDGSNYDVNLSSLYGLNLAGVNFNSGTNELTFTMSDSSTFVSDLTSLSEHVTGMSFSAITNILTLNREIGSDLTANLSVLAENTKVQSATFNAVTRTLTIFSDDGSDVSVVIPAPPDQFVANVVFDTPTRTLSLLMSDATILSTVIPS